MKKISIVFLILIIISNFVVAQNEEENKVQLFKKNTVHFNMSDVIMKRIGFEFEHLLGSEGKISIKVPVSVNLGDANAIYESLYYENYNNINFKYMVDFSDWYVGLGANFYPTGQGAFRFYVGTEIRIGQAHRYPEEYYSDYYYMYSFDGASDIEMPTYEEVDYIQTTFLVNAGIAYKPIENFVVSLNFGVGVSSSYDNTIDPALIPVFRMGYKF